MYFDSETAKQLYEQKDSQELIRIAYIEQTYLPEARALAKAELARRGLEPVDPQMIERVRLEKEEEWEEQMGGMESDYEISPARQMARRMLAPYRLIYILITPPIPLFLIFNSSFNWGMFGLSGRQPLVIGLILAGSFGYLGKLLFGETREQYIRRRRSANEEQ